MDKTRIAVDAYGAGILGLGILMGGYWAYETLNFGGYWNWDPVENAVYVPWLIMIASIHTMIIYKNNQTALKSSVVLVIAVFVLILYSTFLTRSGILGDASVHSFTDLGLSGQLLIYLLFFTSRMQSVWPSGAGNIFLLLIKKPRFTRASSGFFQAQPFFASQDFMSSFQLLTR
jgi:cytochrome c biogenesis factor